MIRGGSSYSVLAWRTGLFLLSLEHFASSCLLISQLLITLAQLDLTYQMFALWKIHPQGSRCMRSVPPLPAITVSAVLGRALGILCLFSGLEPEPWN